MKSKQIIAFLMLLAIPYVSYAKEDWRGKVIDEKGEPVAFANVVLLSKADSSAVVGATTDENGEYNIAGNDKELILMVAMLGYETSYSVPADNMTIILKAQAEFLEGAAISVVMPKTRISPEGLQTSVKGSVLEKIGTANDVLARTPGIIKDHEGIKVIGRGTPIVYVNGRRLTDSSELDRILSSDIQSIEVITNPGAQYDATVNSVVKIRTVRRQGDGFGFSTGLKDAQSLSQKDHNDPSADLNFNYRNGNVDYFAGANYWRVTNFQKSDLYKETMSSPKFIDEGTLNADIIQNGIATNAGINWQIADNHSLGFKVEFTDVLSEDVDQAINDQVSRDGALYEKLLTIGRSGNVGDPYKLNANTYYNGSFGKLGVDFNANYFYTGGRGYQNAIETSSLGIDADVDNESETKNNLYAAKLVLSYPIWGGSLQFGTEDVFTKSTDSYFITGADVANSSSEVHESNYAGFATYSFMLPKFGQMSAGLRYEHVGYEYSDKLFDGSFRRDYDNFFPSVSYSNVFGPVQTMLNFSSKTVRPDFSMLSNAIRYNSRYLLQGGNAKLQPKISTDLGLTTVWKFVTFMANYRKVDDMFVTWSWIYNDEGVILVSAKNLEKPFRGLNAYFNLTPTIGIWSLNYTFGVQKQWLTIDAPDTREGSGFRETKFNDKPMLIAQGFNTFRFKHGWQVELGGVFYNKGNTKNVQLTNNYFNMSAAVQKAFLPDQSLIVRLEGADITGTAKNNIKTDFGNYKVAQTNRMDTQRITLSVRYSFNTARSKYKGTGAGNDTIGRM